MASTIKGINIKIGGDTTALSKALSSVNKQSSSLQSELKQVERALKLDPSNVTLLSQKQQILSEKITATTEKLKILSDAQAEIKRQYAAGEIDGGQYRAFERELEKTTAQLKSLEKESDAMKGIGNDADKSTKEVDELNNELRETEQNEKSIDGSGMKALENGAALAGVAVAAVGTALVAAGKKSVEVGSEFYAEMSRVQGISGATGEEIDKLTEKAKEIGANTKFSASEAAQALEYMSMAGWSTEDMLSGVDGVISAAAASGEDLAKVSDIITDSLTAFGLSAKDSAYFSDLMAAASSNANTNIGMLGESYKNVAATAGAMGYKVDDVTFALGLMANAGIKGGQAGTSLNAVFTRLAKPTKDVQTALSDLSIEATNADGSMKPLNDLLPEMREKFAGLSESQKGQYATMIAGKNAMSGFLTLMNASTADYDKLRSAIDNCDGAAQQMSKTMTDNLAGDMTILGSSLEGLGIQIYENLDDGLRKAAQNGQKAISDISKALQTPKAQQSLKRLGDAIAGGSKKIGELAKNALPPLIDGLAWATENAGKLATITITAVAAIKGYQIAKTVTTALEGMTVAQWALNTAMDANPVGLVVAGLTALVGVTALVVSSFETTEDKVRKNTQALRDQKDAINEEKKAYDDLIAANKEAEQADIDSLGHYEDLWNEMQKLVDENGKIKQGYEDRVHFIANELSEGLGVEIDINNDVIQSYKDIQKEIDNLIEKQKSEIILSYERKNWENAINNRTKAESELNNLIEKRNNLWSDETKWVDEYGKKMTGTDIIRAYTNAERILNTPGYDQQTYSDALSTTRYLAEAYGTINKSFSELDESISSQKSILEGYYSDIVEYETDYAKIMSGDAEKIAEVNGKVTKGYVEDGKKVTLSLQEQANNAKIYYDYLVTHNAPKEMQESAYRAWKQAEEDAEASMSTIVETTEDGAEDVSDAVSGAGDDAVKEAKKATDGVVKELEDGSINARRAAESLGKNISQGIATGVLAMKIQAERAMETAVTDTINRGKVVAEISSPSKRANREIGAFIMPGVAEGITKGLPTAEKAMSAAVDALFNEDYSETKKAISDVSAAGASLMSVDTAASQAAAQSSQAPLWFTEFASGIYSRLEQLEKMAAKSIVLDDGTLVGKMLPQIDEGLGALIS